MRLTSTRNPLLQRVRRAARAGQPTEDGLVAAEGPHLLEEARRGSWEIVQIFVTAEAAERHRELLRGINGGYGNHPRDCGAAEAAHLVLAGYGGQPAGAGCVGRYPGSRECRRDCPVGGSFRRDRNRVSGRLCAGGEREIAAGERRIYFPHSFFGRSSRCRFFDTSQRGIPGSCLRARCEWRKYGEGYGFQRGLRAGGG